ncbi:Calcium release activated channel regulator [Balamuthia mandrillaris]
MEDLCSLAQVCHHFAALSREDLLWRPLGSPSWLREDERGGEGGDHGEYGGWKRRYLVWLRRTLEEWHAAVRPCFQKNTREKQEQEAPEEDEPKELVMHFSLIGTRGAGKTSFGRRFGNGEFQDWRYCNLGTDFTVRQSLVLPNGARAKVFLWDPCGSERPRIPHLLLRKKQGLVICYDSTDQTSFSALEKWLEITNDLAVSRGKEFWHAARVIVACKCDVQNSCKVNDTMAEEMAAKWHAFAHFRTSAKTGENVEEAVEALVEATLDPFQRLPPCHRPRYMPSLAALRSRHKHSALLFPHRAQPPPPPKTEDGEHKPWYCVGQ